MRKDVSPEDHSRKVRQHIRYDQTKVALFWRHRGQELFDSKVKARAWNSKNENQPALDVTYTNGRVGGMFFGKRLYTCDVVWLFEHGSWPHGDIYHRNGDMSDNRRSNMMVVKPQITCHETGFIGVVWNLYFQKWEAIVQKPNGEGAKYLGYFADPQDAAMSYDAAAMQYWGDLAALNFKMETA
jgi:hypothetical protein